MKPHTSNVKASVIRRWSVCVEAACCVAFLATSAAAEPAPSATASFPLLTAAPAVPAAVQAPAPAPAAPTRVASAQPVPAPAPVYAPGPYYNAAPGNNGWAYSSTNSYGQGAPVAPAGPQVDTGASHERKSSANKDWMLALSLVTRAPVDAGIEAGLEMPFGLRFAAAYGFMPGPYVHVITGALSGAGAIDGQAQALIEDGFQTGHSWRIQTGIRPFKNFGLYLDGGYARVNITGSVDASEVPDLNLVGTYDVSSHIDFWFLELGYQGVIADRMVLAGGFGLMRAFNASTSVSTNSSAAKVLNMFDDTVTSEVDNAIQKYGFIPTLNLRLGFDLI